MGLQSTPSDEITRRQALRQMGAAGLGVAAAGAGVESLISQALAAAPKTGSLKDIRHVVILIQENRSFDHYFGTYSGVRGFADKLGRNAFFQKDLKGKTVHPWHLPKDCLPDLTHEWGPQHLSWNGGKMDKFLIEHLKNDIPSVYGVPVGTGYETMGYYDKNDLRFYHALANAFTICDGYHCSVIGPTDPNRLLSMSGTLDPAGRRGGPLVQTLVATRAKMSGKFTWTTMPEQLEARGISWKVYSSSPTGILDNVLPYFPPYQKGAKLYSKGIAPTWPQDFNADIASGRLPQVSWVLTSLQQSEHPGFSGALAGEIAARQIFESLVSNPKVWKNTALFITWDENGGFFDHVKPPTPPAGTAGEFLTVSTLPKAADGIRGPIGLGFRVPMLVVSPFSTGGLVSSDTFDHTSTLRFLETRFGAEVPNLSAWRRKTCGDLTSAFNFAAKPDYKKRSLPQPDAGSTGACTNPTPVPLPSQPFPKQATGKRKRPSGIVK
jgi:phospholipase C